MELIKDNMPDIRDQNNSITMKNKKKRLIKILKN